MDVENKVIEKIGELLQAIMKARRFGYFKSHPDSPITNITQIENEIVDLKLALRDYDLHLYSLGQEERNLA